MHRKGKCRLRGVVSGTILIVLILLTLGCTNEYDIEARVEPEGAGFIIGEGTYRQGEDVAIKAEAYEGFRFLHWEENGEVMTRSWNYPFIVREDRSLVAVFESVDE